jgi:putative FmdB family regulatory protein
MVMPIYEYACDDCKQNFEVFVGVHDAPVHECKHCAGKNIRKLISNCSFQLKGTGWYKTDYAAKDAGGSNGAKKSTDSDKPGTDTAESASKDSTSEKKSSDSVSSKASSSEKAA